MHDQPQEPPACLDANRGSGRCAKDRRPQRALSYAMRTSSRKNAVVAAVEMCTRSRKADASRCHAKERRRHDVDAAANARCADSHQGDMHWQSQRTQEAGGGD
eukprot:jgi/Mesvir1/12142/Mv00395-RA.1